MARAVKSWWSGCGLVVARARALAVELQWSGGGFVVARAAALLQRGIGCGSGSGQLGGGMIINETRNNLWV